MNAFVVVSASCSLFRLADLLELVPRLAKLADKNDEEFFAVLSKSERKVLTAILQKVASHHQLTKMHVE